MIHSNKKAETKGERSSPLNNHTVLVHKIKEMSKETFTVSWVSESPEKLDFK